MQLLQNLVRVTCANLRSAGAGVGAGGVTQLPNLSGLVIGTFLQMRMLSIRVPLMVPGSH